MNYLQLLGAVETGLIYSFVAIGVYITFKIISFPDLTVDGSFTLGAAVSAVMIFTNYNPYIATMFSILSGACAGCITGYLNVRWNILGLLAGILTMTSLYSINWRIMGRANIAIIDKKTVFHHGWSVILIVSCLNISLVLILKRFFNSELGLAIRASGQHPKASCAYGIKVGTMKIVSLAISNGIIALAGSLCVQSQGFSDINLGSGTIIIALLSIIVGESLFCPEKIWSGLIACTFGSILYRITIVTLSLNTYNLGLKTSDLNLATALIIAVLLKITKGNSTQSI